MRVTKVYTETLRAYKDKVRLLVHKGSSRSGKTRGVIQAFDTMACLSKKHRKLSICSQSYPHLREGAIYEYEKHVREEQLLQTRIHRETRHEFAVGKCVINYFSLDDEAKAIGPGRNIILVNEPNKGVKFDIYQQLNIRTDEMFVMDYNPSGTFWLHTNKLLDSPGARLITSTWMDNIENLTKAQIDEFMLAYERSKTSDYWHWWWKVYGEGQDAILLEERIMPFLKRVKEVPDDAIEIPSGLDFGFYPDPTAFLRLWVRPRKDKFAFDDLYIKCIVYDTRLSIDAKGEGAKNLCTILLERDVNKNHLIIAESADPRAINDMRSAGFNVRAVKKKTVETSIRKFHEYNIHIVDTKQPEEDDDPVYIEFDNYKYKRDKATGILLQVPEDKQADHTVDAARYVLMGRDKTWAV